MKNTLRLLATTSFVTLMGLPVFAQTEIDVGAMTCAEFGAMEGEALVAVIEAIGAMPLPDDEMAEDGVANNELDPGSDSDDSTAMDSSEDGAAVENAMSEEDVATDALQADSGSDDLGATITAACVDMGDMTVVEALKASTN